MNSFSPDCESAPITTRIKIIATSFWYDLVAKGSLIINYDCIAVKTRKSSIL